MKTNKFLIVLILLFFACEVVHADTIPSPYLVFNASKGVILKSSKHGIIENPRRGTEVYKDDVFSLRDERYYIKIKDRYSGEIHSFNGKANITPKEIVNSDKYGQFEKFASFILSLAEEFGCETSPIRTSQCVSHKGGGNEPNDSLSSIVALQIRKAIDDSLYSSIIDINKVYTEERESFTYSIMNKDTACYAAVIFTVGNDNVAYNHNEIIIKKGEDFSPDALECIRLIGHYQINLSYLEFSALNNDDNRTCYVLFFKTDDFYNKRYSGKFDKIMNWKSIAEELTYQGDVRRAIYISR